MAIDREEAERLALAEAQRAQGPGTEVSVDPSRTLVRPGAFLVVVDGLGGVIVDRATGAIVPVAAGQRLEEALDHYVSALDPTEAIPVTPTPPPPFEPTMAMPVIPPTVATRRVALERRDNRGPAVLIAIAILVVLIAVALLLLLNNKDNASTTGDTTTTTVATTASSATSSTTASTAPTTTAPPAATTTAGPLARPSSIDVAPGGGSGEITVQWSDPSDSRVVGYRLYRKPVPDTTGYVFIYAEDRGAGTPCSASFTHCYNDVPGSGRYCYIIKSVDAGGTESAPSPEKCATTVGG
jgi:hypothetical protein